MGRRASASANSRSERVPPGPLYRQIVQTLKREIVSGVYPVDSQLPPEGVLQKRFNVSRYTVREALRELRDAGLVTSRRGIGTTVLRPGAPRPYVHDVAAISDLIELANATKYDVHSSEIIVVDRALADQLGGEVGAKWLRVEGFRYAPGDTRPVCWTEVYVQGDFAGVARMIGRRPGPIYLWIEDLYGESVDEVDQLVQARAVPANIAASLGVASGGTVIEVKRSYRLSSGVVAEVAVNLYPPERFQLAMTLRRSKP